MQGKEIKITSEEGLANARKERSILPPSDIIDLSIGEMVVEVKNTG